jgi:hypothetical protein
MGFTDPQWRLFIVHASCKFHRRWVESISLRRICRGKYMYIYSRFQRKILCSNDCRSHRQAQETEGWTILRATCIRRRKEQPLTTLLLLDFVRCPKPRFGPSAYHTVYARTYACLCFFAPHHNGYRTESWRYIREHLYGRPLRRLTSAGWPISDAAPGLLGLSTRSVGCGVQQKGEGWRSGLTHICCPLRVILTTKLPRSRCSPL